MSHAEIFAAIYKRGAWKMTPTTPLSGTGSTAEVTLGYRQVLIDFLTKVNAKSVVDFGCGDWTFSQLIDWAGMGISYLGLDVCKEVVETNVKTFSRSGRKDADEKV